MASIINATTTAGVSVAGDNSGSLQLATNNGTTAVTIDTSQRVAFVACTVALPAITTTGDTNTGIFFPAADTIAFTEGGAEAMRINSSGQVGIGTTSPSYKLQVTSTVANQEVIFVQTSNTNTGTGLAGEGPFALQNTNTTVGNMAAISNFDGNGNINSQINFVNIDHSGSSSIAFTTRSGGSYAERMRITEGGVLLVNDTSLLIASSLDKVQIACSAPSGGNQYGEMIGGNAQSYTVYAMRFVNTYTPAVVGTITIGSSSTAYNTSSDYRLKENIAPMTGALAKVTALKPCTYKWKLDGSDGEGFIAHELAEVCPHAVSGEKDALNKDGDIEPQGIDTSFLVATLTAAIQELNAKVEAQAVRIAELEGAK
jgi:hypothetical protein